MQRKSIFILKLSITVLLLGALAWRVDWKIMMARAEILRWEWALLAIGLGHLDRILMAWKWRLLIQSQGVIVSLKNAVANTYMGNFAGLFLPAGVGGDLVRVFLLKRIHLPMTTTAASIIVERVFGMYALVALTCLAVGGASFVGVEIPHEIIGWISLAFVMSSIAIILSFSSLIRKVVAWLHKRYQQFNILEKATNLFNAYQWYGGKKKILCWFLLLSLLEACLTSVVFAVSAWSIDLKIHIIQFMVIVPIILFIQRIPISINGIGVQEGLIAFFLLVLGESMESAVAFSILLRIYQLFIVAPGAILCFKTKIEQKCDTRCQTI